ncbi:MAG: aminotransferase class IV, partial [Candidatus Binatia bacterium]
RIERLQRSGVRVVLLPFHPGLGGLLAGHKTLDYLTAMVGKRIAARRRAFEGIYTAPTGEIFEGTTANLFLVDGRSLLTPPLRSGVLPGITRELVMRRARGLGVTVREERLFPRHVQRAGEAFLTASTIGVMPIRQIGHRHLRGGVGLLTRKLQRLLAPRPVRARFARQ